MMLNVEEKSSFVCSIMAWLPRRLTTTNHPGLGPGKKNEGGASGYRAAVHTIIPFEKGVNQFLHVQWWAETS